MILTPSRISQVFPRSTLFAFLIGLVLDKKRLPASVVLAAFFTFLLPYGSQLAAVAVSTVVKLMLTYALDTKPCQCILSYAGPASIPAHPSTI